MNKKRKIKDYEIYNKFNYYKFMRYKVKNKINGALYYLCDPLSDQDKTELLNKYNNIMFFKSQCQYAPEITKDIIFIGDKVINK